MAVRGDGEEMEKDFEVKLRLQQQSPLPSSKPSSMQRNSSIAFRAPQEQFTIDDFELGKIYGVGSYSKKKRLSEDEACFYAAEAIDALEYLHGLGLIHRDIKMKRHVLLWEQLHTSLQKFSVLLQQPMDLVEIFSDMMSVSCISNDLWALGCTIYQMLSGSSPFKDASEWLIFQRIIARDLEFPAYFSDEARDLIDKLLVAFGYPNGITK
ncbi:hypothetical protein COCNU_scaffold009510G000010 [Cocos nucifera]|nr:hypothetical protein [Cocos nucifera]